MTKKLSKICFFIPGSATDAAVVNSDGIKMFLANGLSKSFIIDKPVMVEEVYLAIPLIILF